MEWRCHPQVFADADEDQSLIVEIVEHDAAVADADCGAYYWRDLAEQSEASSSQLDSIATLGASHHRPALLRFTCLMPA